MNKYIAVLITSLILVLLYPMLLGKLFDAKDQPHATIERSSGTRSDSSNTVVIDTIIPGDDQGFRSEQGAGYDNVLIGTDNTVITGDSRNELENAQQQLFEQAFADHYQTPVECQNWGSNENMVDCVNHRMVEKVKFREQWLKNNSP